VFKRKFKDQFIILSVTYRLCKKPVYNTAYGAIKEELLKMNISDLSIKAISQAVINIRSSKLPDPKEIGNAGSFFKNPTVSSEIFSSLKLKFPALVGYPVDNGMVKLAAGWLIEHCGPSNAISWKGFRKGDAGCHSKQALVLVNHGHAKGNEIYELSKSIIESVKYKFGVELEREVNII
jgi:UDP-N-acetylmuramate dehydrogenase